MPPERRTTRLLWSLAGVAALLTLAVMVAACGTESEPADGGSDRAPLATQGTAERTLRGNITVEGALELSHIPASRVVVRLDDVSLLDAPSVLIAERVYAGVTALPLAYELMWTGDLDAELRYAVSARVYDGAGELLFWTDTEFPVRPSDVTVDFFIVSAIAS